MPTPEHTQKTLYFIRHAESELNRDRTNVGGTSSWCELNALGIEQAKSLGRRLARESMYFDRVCVSTTVRTQQTARYALQEAGWALSRMEYSDQLVEISQGIWEGKPRAEIMTPEVVEQMRTLGWLFRPPGGESPQDVAQRMEAWLTQEILPGPGQHIAIVTHGFVIRSVWAACLGYDIKTLIETPIQNTSINTMVYSPDLGYRHVSLNDITHLQEDDVGRLSGKLRRDKDKHEHES